VSDEENGLVRANRFRIEVVKSHLLPIYSVRVEPVQYLGRKEFGRCSRELSRLYMNLQTRRPWRWTRNFDREELARACAEELARSLGEFAYLDVGGRVCLVI